MALPSNRAIAFMCDTLAGIAIFALTVLFAMLSDVSSAGGFLGLFAILGIAYAIGLVRGLIDFRHFPEEPSDG